MDESGSDRDRCSVFEMGDHADFVYIVKEGEIRELGIEVRAGLHSGECELRNGDIGGMAVHIGARVAGKAGPGEVLVSGTVKDLVVGSGIEFEDRGSTALKGVPDEWRLYAVRALG